MKVKKKKKKLSVKVINKAFQICVYMTHNNKISYHYHILQHVNLKLLFKINSYTDNGIQVFKISATS